MNEVEAYKEKKIEQMLAGTGKGNFIEDMACMCRVFRNDIDKGVFTEEYLAKRVRKCYEDNKA